jgi:hypothetical protein
VICGAFGPALAQTPDRDWQKGTWAASPAARGRAAARTYTIETVDFRYDIEDTSTGRGAGATDLAVSAGEAVTFALDKDNVFVKVNETAERQLRLVKATRKLKSYAAAGSGHFIKSIGEQGKTITLEDGSVWEIEPETQYEIGSVWQPFHGIDVRASDEEDGYNYSLSNTDLDRGTMARLAPVSK